LFCGHGGGDDDDDDGARLHPHVSGETCANVSTGDSILSNQSLAVPVVPLLDHSEDSLRPWVRPDRPVVAAAAVEVGIVVSDMEAADTVVAQA